MTLHIIPVNLNVVVDDDGIAHHLELVRGHRVIKIHTGMVDPSVYYSAIKDAGFRKKGV